MYNIMLLIFNTFNICTHVLASYIAILFDYTLIFQLSVGWKLWTGCKRDSPIQNREPPSIFHKLWGMKVLARLEVLIRKMHPLKLKQILLIYPI